MQRIVLHIDMDAFFAAIEERDNPQFANRPIVVGADPKKGFGRGVVSTANYEARKYGIHSAMPISWAYRACPNAIFLPVDINRYKKVSEEIMKIIAKYSDSVEQVSLDEAYLELKNTDYENAVKIAIAIKEEINKKERLTASVGIGPNKLIAKIASDHQKPDGLTVVKEQEVQDFLDQKPVEAIPGIGPKTAALLREKWGVTKVRELRQIPKAHLVREFGKNGETIYEMARGQDPRPVQKREEAKSIGKQVTFEKDIDKSQTVFAALFDMLKEIFEELKNKKAQAYSLTIVVRYADFTTISKQKTLEKPLDQKTAQRIALQLILPYLGKQKIRLVGIRVSRLKRDI
jgi:DNA polymerase IV (DinB-like DNA polymerase)